MNYPPGQEDIDNLPEDTDWLEDFDNSELYDLADEWCHDWCGEDGLTPYLYEMIKEPSQRNGSLWEEFIEWVQDYDFIGNNDTPRND